MKLKLALILFLFIIWGGEIAAQCTNTLYALRANITVQGVAERLVVTTDKAIVTTKRVDFTFSVANTVGDLQVDFGTGFVPLQTQMSVTFASFGAQTIKIRRSAPLNIATFTVNIKTLDVATSAYRRPDEIWELSTPNVFIPSTSCSNAYDVSNPDRQPTRGFANAYIRYANPTLRRLTKPLIFVEGVDFNKNTVCDPDASKTIRFGDFGWDVFNLGFDETDGFDFLRLMPDALKALKDESYDIILLDFKDGADYIQKNGELLIELIKRINQEKVINSNGNCQDITVLGASMGGQVSRWALATMEKRNIPHSVASFISFDSPHQGANISLSLQAGAWFSAHLSDPAKRDVSTWKDKLERPAARQMLAEHFGAAVQAGRLSINTFAESRLNRGHLVNLDYACLRNQYVAEMTALGYPKQCRLVGIANGNGSGLGMPYNAGDNIFDSQIIALANGFGTVGQLDMWALPGGHSSANVNVTSCIYSIDETNVIFTGAFPATQNPVTDAPTSYDAIFVKVVQPNSFVNWDNAPGGSRNDLRGLRTAIEAQNLTSGISARVHNIQMPQCFIPTFPFNRTVKNRFYKLSDEYL